MLIYLLLFLTLLWLFFMEKIVPLNRKSLFYYIAGAVLVAFSGFRFDIGWDYGAYYSTIKYNLETNIVLRGETLTILLIDISRKLNIPNLFFLINSLLCVILIFITNSKYSKNRWISLFWFVAFPLFFLNSLSVVRMFTAVAISYFAFRFLVQKKFLLYFLFICIAGLFHSSAFIALIFYFASKLKLRSFYLIPLLFLLPFIGEIVNNIVLNHFPKYTPYINETNVQEGTKAIFVFILLGILAILFKSKLVAHDKNAEIYINCFLIGLSIYLVFFNQGTMGHRLSLYGTIYSLLLVPKLISLFKGVNKRLFEYSVYTGCFIMFLYSVFVGQETFIPYMTIFNTN